MLYMFLIIKYMYLVVKVSLIRDCTMIQPKCKRSNTFAT